MKIKPALHRFLLPASSTLLAMACAHAADGTWNGISGAWSDTTNPGGVWRSGLPADGAGSSAFFTGLDIADDRTINLDDTGRTIGNITFTDATTSSHNLSIAGANILTLDVASGTPIINVTQADRTLTIASEVAGADGLTKIGAGTLTLGGANTYTGTTAVSGGTLDLSGNRTAASGGVSVNAGVLNISNGDFSMGTNGFLVGIGGTSTVNQTAGAIAFAGTGNQILMGNGAGDGIYNLSGGSLTFSAVTNRGIFLGVNTGRSGTFNLSGSGAINMAAGSYLLIGRSDGGTDTGTSGYFNQSGGTAGVGILRMGGGAAGASGTTADLNLSGGTFSAGTFSMLSRGDSSSSAINISGTADVTLPAFPLGLGTGSTAVITFDGGTLKNSVASTNYLGGVTGAFVKAGGAKINTTGGHITLTQALQEDPLSTGGGLTKEGANTLTLGATNSYTGATTINGGTLQVGIAGVINPVTIGNFSFETPTTAGFTYTPSGASWAFIGAGVARNTFFVNAPPQGLQAGFLQSAAASISQTINVGADGFYRIAFQAQGRGAAYGPLGIIVRVDGVTVGSWDHTAISQSQWFNYSAAVYLAAGDHTLTFLGNNTAGGDKSSSIDNVQMNQPTGSLPATTAVNLTASGATLDLNGTTQTIGSLAGVAGSSVTNGNLIVGGADRTAFAGVLSGGGGLTLSGAGSLTLTGANTYTGATTLNAGTLALGADNVLPNLSDVSIGAATLDAAGFDDTMGTLDITAAATINVGTGANLVFDGATATWAGTLNITGTFVSGSSLNFGIGGLTPAQLAQITVNGGGGPFSLDGSGYLVGGGGPTGFAAWQAANSTAGGIDEDHDHDGVSNGIEYFLAGPAPSGGFTTLPAITANGNTFSITWTKSADYIGIYNTDYMVETSATLADPWTTEAPGVNVTISGNDITYTFPLPLGTKNFARLKVTGP